jgi:NADPH:quinone reductase-like Zn-dependent oxidoreductase
MKCAQIVDNKIEFKWIPIPKAKSGERLIKVKAFAVNRADLLQIEGLYDPPDGSIIPGLEVSGVDVNTGENVCALLESGGYAEYVCVNSLQVIPKPKSFSLEESAAFLEALVTCHMNIFASAKAETGETILIHGGSSGIGSFAIKMCKLKRLKIIASASKPLGMDRCLKAGADLVINYTEDFDIQLKRQVDIVLDILGGPYLSKNLKCLKPGGRLCLIAVMTGSKAEVNLGSILINNLSITGATLRSKSSERKRELIEAAWQDFGMHIEAGELKPIIDSVFEFQDLPKALQRVTSREHFGKVVITL